MPRVLITGARAPASLEWVRAFAAAGWTVFAADSLHWPLARFSRHLTRFVHLPEAASNLTAWSTALSSAIAQHGIDLVLPTCEEAFYLAHQKPLLATRCRVLVSDFELMRRVHHKGEFARLVAGWPCSTPETHELHERSQLAAFAADSQHWVFKPAFSRFATATLIRPQPAQVLALQPDADRPWIAQRFAAGKEFCSFSLLQDGQLLAHAAYHPRYRVGSGAGIYLEHARTAALRAFVEQFAAATGFCGQVGFDFIEAADGSLQVLECNPRATSGVHLFRHQACQLVQALTAGTSSTVLPDNTTDHMVGLAMLLFGSMRYGLQGGGFWRDWLAADDVIHDHNDRLPALMQLPGFAEIALRALRRRQSLLQASTVDIEWNGQTLPETIP